MEKKDEQVEAVKPLNAPILEVEGIEKLEDRSEMKKSRWLTSNLCSNSFYGNCK